MAINVTMEGVSYTISATDVSGPAIESAIRNQGKLAGSTDTLAQKTKSSFDAIQKHYVGFAVAAAAAIATVDKVWSMAKIGAGFDEQRSMLDNLAVKYGSTADTIVSEMDRASGHQIAKSELMSIALAGISKGLKPQQLIDLAAAAETLGDAAGKDAATALRDLTEALETGRTKGLKNYLGTTLDLESSFVGLESKMTAAEKTQAMYNITMMAAIDLQKQQKKAVDDSADKLAVIEKRFDDVTLAASRLAKSAVVSVWDNLAAVLNPLTPGAGIMSAFKTAAEQTAEATKKQNEEVKKTAQPYLDQNEALKKILETRKTSTELTKEHKKSLEDESKAWGDIADQEFAILAAVTAAENKATIEKTDFAEEQKKTSLGVYDYEYQLIDDELERAIAAGKETVANAKADKEEEKAIAGGLYDYLIQQYDDDQAAAIAVGQEKIQAAEQLPQMYRDVYSDIRGAEQSEYDASLVVIQKQADAYEKAGMDQVVVARWKANEEETAWIKMAAAGDNFFDGVTAGLKKSERDMMTWGKAGAKIFDTFSKSSADAISDTLFHAIKEGSVDAEEIFKSFADSMLRNFTDTIGQMVAEAAARQIVLGFKTSWVDTGASVINFIANVLGIGYGATSSSGGSAGYSTGMGAGSGGASGYEQGGQFPGGSPIWVGERGKELLFPVEAGYILDHQKSMDYAAMSGGHIPEYGLGGFFSKGLNILTGGVYGAVSGNWGGTKAYWDFLNPGVVSAFNAAHSSNVWDFIDAVFDPVTGPGLTNLLQSTGKTVNELIPWIGDLVDAIAPIIGGLVGGIYGGPGGAAGGAAAGSGIASKWNNYPTDDAVKKAAITAAVTYVAGQAGSAAGSAVGGGAGGTAASTAVSYATKWLMGNLFNAAFPPEGGQVKFSYEGANDSGLLSSLSALMSNIAPKSSTFAFSARNGLDYVPYDGFRAELHKGERVQTAEEVRSGSAPIVIHNHLYIDGKEIKVIADKVVVDRNKRAVNQAMRLYQ